MPKYHVKRSVQINASAQQVYDVVVDLGSWTKWSPWLCAEPDATVTVSDNATRVGSVYSWNGDVVGQGEVEHKKLTPGQSVAQEIRFLKPFKSVSQVGFEFESAGDGTQVSWYMDGALPLLLFWMKSSMETYIAMDFDRGLSMLKEYIETGSVQATTIIRGIESVGPMRVAGIRRTCSMDDCGPSMKSAYEQTAEVFDKYGLCTAEGAISVYHAADLKKRMFDCTSGFVLPDSADLPNGLTDCSIPALNAFCVEQIGSYDHLGNAWSAAHQNLRGRKLKSSRKTPGFEVYVNDPEQTPVAELRTEVYLPLR